MAKSRYRHHIKLESIETPKDVINELKRLDPLLSGSELLQVAFFNRAYLIVTERIHQAGLNGEFKLSAIMNNLEVVFARRYFEALNHYTVNDTLPGAWAKINRGWLHAKHPSSLSLMLGANAHINYDLPVALKEAIRKPGEFEADYFKVNRLLVESSRAILHSYYESEQPINFIKHRLHGIYLRPTMSLILRWRKKAWDELVVLSRSG